MAHNSGARGRTRDIGLNHQAGKGSTNRSNSKKFRDGFEDIFFPLGAVEGFVQRGGKLVKTYGAKTEEIVFYTSKPDLLGVAELIPLHHPGCQCTK